MCAAGSACGRCRSARTGRRRAGGRCAPRSRPSPRVRPCLRPAGRRGRRLRAAGRVAAPRTSRRDSVSPPAVDTTIAWMRSPTATSSAPSSSFSSATSIVASPLPPTSTNATSGPMATIVPSMVCPRSKRFALIDASNIAAKSSSGSLTMSLLRSRSSLRPASLGRTLPPLPRSAPATALQQLIIRAGAPLRAWTSPSASRPRRRTPGRRARAEGWMVTDALRLERPTHAARGCPLLSGVRARQRFLPRRSAARCRARRSARCRGPARHGGELIEGDLLERLGLRAGESELVGRALDLAEGPRSRPVSVPKIISASRVYP